MDLYSEVVDVPIDEVDKEENEEENGNTPESSMLAASAAAGERVTKRAKRPSKYLMKHIKEGSSSPNGQNNGGAEGSAVVLNGTARTAKNMRRPRNGYGRGLPKKGNLFATLVLSSFFKTDTLIGF